MSSDMNPATTQQQATCSTSAERHLLEEVQGCYTADLSFPASNRATHDEPMPPDPSIPLRSYPLDLDILKTGFGEPLQQPASLLGQQHLRYI